LNVIRANVAQPSIAKGYEKWKKKWRRDAHKKTNFRTKKEAQNLAPLIVFCQKKNKVSFLQLVFIESRKNCENSTFQKPLYHLILMFTNQPFFFHFTLEQKEELHCKEYSSTCGFSCFLFWLMQLQKFGLRYYFWRI